MVSQVTSKLSAFFGAFDRLEFARGETILRADENPITHIYYIISGFARQYSLSRDGEEKTIMLFRKGSYIPTVYALNHGEKNHYFFEATTPLVVHKAPVQKVVDFLHENPDVLFDLTLRLSRGLEMISVVLENIMSTCAQCKIAAVLLTFAKRFGNKTGNMVEIGIPLTHKEIGSFAGVTRETVSREVQKLIDMKILEKKDNLYTIRDINRFEELLTA